MEDTNNTYKEQVLPLIVKAFDVENPSNDFESINNFTTEWSEVYYRDPACLVESLHYLN